MAARPTLGAPAEDAELGWPVGGRDDRWPLFAQGGPGDQATPNAWQLMILSDLCGPDGRCPEATDDEVLGVLGQWGAAASWVEGRKLAVVRELIRRRPHERNAGTATESGLPWDWDDGLAREVSLRLSVSVPGARKLIWTAWALEARLPGIGKALDEGRLDAGRTRMVVEETSVLLEPGMLARAERLILDGLARCRTWTDLLRLVQRAVVTVDPSGAQKRREQAERENARVRFWREAAGTCALMGAGLPTDEALRAHARVEQRAQAYRQAGIRRPIDILRVAAYLDLLNGVPMSDRIARFAAEDDAQSPEDHEQAARDARLRAAARRAAAQHQGQHQHQHQGHETPDTQPASGDDPDPGQQAAGSAGGADHADGFPPDGRPGSSDGPAEAGGLAANGGALDRAAGVGLTADGGTPPGGDDGAVASEVNLTLRHLDIPLLTVLGHAERPGEARSLGTLDPALARRLAEAAAHHPDSKFCLTIVNREGHAIGHGCCKPRKPRKGQRDGPPPPAGFVFAPTDDPGPPGGLGSWILTLPGRAGMFTVDLHSVPTGECRHDHESARHDPGDLLRHLVTIRDGKCGFPTCSRHARESDFEHARPFGQGGRTCGCNCWSCSRSCHQLKQSDGWDVTETAPGYHQWRTPSGRTYTQPPWQYPA